MSTWYRIDDSGYTIKAVEVTGETEEFIDLKGGRRELKVGSHNRYFSTRKEAVEYLTERGRQEVTSLIRSLDKEEKKLRLFLASEYLPPA